MSTKRTSGSDPKSSKSEHQGTAAEVKRTLTELKNPEKAAFLPKFFQAVPGGYGEGDKFLGVVVPNQRKVARQFRDLPRDQLDRLIRDPHHECRLTAVFILSGQFKRNRDRAARKEIVEWLLNHSAGLNNWDLVDSSGPQIIGEYLRTEKDRRLLFQLAKSKNLWEQRLSIVSNMPLIKQGEFDCILELAEKFLSHPHDLVHKAVGWMLREMDQVDRTVLIGFLDRFSSQMPRTMLRYAIEKFPENLRQHYLSFGK